MFHGYHGHHVKDIPRKVSAVIGNTLEYHIKEGFTGTGEWIYRLMINGGILRMAYYFIVDTYVSETGQAQYHEYITEVKPIVEKYGGRYLVRTNDITSLNNKRCPQRSIVIEFPDREMLDDCFSSEEYKAIMMKRVNSVDSRAIIVPGIDEEGEDENTPVKN